MRDVAVGAPHALFCQAIEIRRGNVAATVEAHVGVAQVVRQDDKDVGPHRLGRVGRAERRWGGNNETGKEKKGRVQGLCHGGSVA